jgi:hypothetical protein
MYVLVGDSHQDVEFCFDRTVAPIDFSSVGLAVTNM